MKKRGSYFFVIDAFIAGAIMFITLIIIYSSYFNAPKTEQPRLITEDYLSFLLNTEMRDLDNEYRDILFEKGLVSDVRRTVFEQIAELHYLGEHDHAAEFVANITTGVIPSQFGVAYYIYDINADPGEPVYERNPDESKDRADFVISTKKLTYFKIDAATPIGPAITEVQVWPIQI